MGVNEAVGVQAVFACAYKHLHTHTHTRARTKVAEQLISCKAELGAEPVLGLEDTEQLQGCVRARFRCRLLCKRNKSSYMYVNILILSPLKKYGPLLLYI